MVAVGAIFDTELHFAIILAMYVGGGDLAPFYLYSYFYLIIVHIHVMIWTCIRKCSLPYILFFMNCKLKYTFIDQLASQNAITAQHKMLIGSHFLGC